MEFDKQYADDAFRRVQVHLDKSAPEAQGLKDTDGRKQLDEVVDALDQQATEQTTLAMQMDGFSQQQVQLEAELKNEHLKPIADFARGKLRGKPNYATFIQPVSQLFGKRLVLHARAVAEAAAPYLADLASGGFPQDTIVQLSTVADQLATAVEGRANLKVRRAGSTQAVKEQTQRGRDAVRMLNGLIQKQYAKDKPFLASWRVARRIVLKPGFSRGSKNAGGQAAPTVVAQPKAPVVAPVTPAGDVQPVTSTAGPVQGSKA